MATARPPRSRPVLVLTGAWWLAAAVLAVVGWLAFAVSDSADDRTAGVVLLLAAALAAGAGVHVLRRGPGAARTSQVASGAVALLGVGAAVLVAVVSPVFLADVLLIGGVPVVAAGLTALLAARVVRPV